MHRRETLAALATTALAGAALAQSKDKGEAMPAQHHHHHHAKARYADLVEASTHCLEAGELCIAHCLQLLGEGDKSMAACARTVADMLAACRTLSGMAARDSRFVRAYAKLTAEVCKTCEDECRKHEDKHAQCRDCAASCEACGKACRAASA